MYKPQSIQTLRMRAEVSTIWLVPQLETKQHFVMPQSATASYQAKSNDPYPTTKESS